METQKEVDAECSPQGRVYSINHRRDTAANAKASRRRVAEDDEEDATPDVAEALPPQVAAREQWPRWSQSRHERFFSDCNARGQRWLIEVVTHVACVVREICTTKLAFATPNGV